MCTQDTHYTHYTHYTHSPHYTHHTHYTHSPPYTHYTYDRGYIGEVAHEEFLLGRSIQGAKVYLYPHLHFSVGYNNDQIVTGI